MAFTYFFRDIHTLKSVCTNCLPHMKTRKYLKIWDAGCAMGPEPYSLAIMLYERMSNMYYRNVKVVATDIDVSNLFKDAIESGMYREEILKRIPENIFGKYFIKADNDDYRIIDDIKKGVKFIKHDLLSMDPVGNEFAMIMCKNVLLHFSEEQRNKVIEMFYNSLSKGGYLVMEQTQKLPYSMESKFTRVVPDAQIYMKIGEEEF